MHAVSDRMKQPLSYLPWLAVALAGASAYATLARHRGEHISSACVPLAALCTYAIGHWSYSKWVAALVLPSTTAAPACDSANSGPSCSRAVQYDQQLA